MNPFIHFFGFFVCLFSTVASPITWGAAWANPSQNVLAPLLAQIREGDIIFHKSRSNQSGAIAEAQGNNPWTHMGVLLEVTTGSSNWRVFEAIQPVRLTPLRDFIARGRGSEFEVKRWISPYDEQVAQKVDLLKQTLLEFMGVNYDLFFEWSEERLYCSELVYKAYAKAFPELPKIAALQKLGDLRLDGPKMKALIKKRSDAAGHSPNMEEPILTPAQLINSPYLTTVVKNYRR